ncbi:acyl-CoA thioesterase [Cryobacterium melibiosiphilum]|uniref:Acyl-CoA thioesterase n=1 Tax=Cryobacterium melibiosiphilum TaxID=995039 RepID=A0A3A5MPZ4_9MICO|nr:thioesterase family protein [Cryobacterium melibiosiphilum]RJT89033.1 acyl-CoA thioesterase [Cryobacterium melibiosiphilum]
MSTDTPRSGPNARETIIAVTLRWGDMDAFRHVNNVEYFRYLEEARARLFPTEGDGSSFLRRGIVIASQTLNYLAPLTYRREPVLVGLTVTTVGRSSFTLGCRVFDTDDADTDVVFATGSVVVVAFDDQAGRSRPLEPAERRWLESLGGVAHLD